MRHRLLVERGHRDSGAVERGARRCPLHEACRDRKERALSEDDDPSPAPRGGLEVLVRHRRGRRARAPLFPRGSNEQVARHHRHALVRDQTGAGLRGRRSLQRRLGSRRGRPHSARDRVRRRRRQREGRRRERGGDPRDDPRRHHGLPHRRRLLRPRRRDRHVPEPRGLAAVRDVHLGRHEHDRRPPPVPGGERPRGVRLRCKDAELLREQRRHDREPERGGRRHHREERARRQPQRLGALCAGELRADRDRLESASRARHRVRCACRRSAAHAALERGQWCDPARDHERRRLGRGRVRLPPGSLLRRGARHDGERDLADRGDRREVHARPRDHRRAEREVHRQHSDRERVALGRDGRGDGRRVRPRAADGDGPGWGAGLFAGLSGRRREGRRRGERSDEALQVRAEFEEGEVGEGER